MQTPITYNGVTFNHNIEILRDISDAIGAHNMANGYDRYSWAVTEHGRIQVMIRYRDKHVLVEFEGDGICVMTECDSYGHPIDENKRVLFDSHWYTGSNIKDAFALTVKKNFGIYV